MAQFAASADARRHLAGTPWWLWPNLLALDAPLVAVLWQVLLARTLVVHLRFAQVAGLAVTCWLVYATDYLIDSWSARPDAALSSRHEFFRSHRASLAAALVAGCGVLLTSASSLGPDTITHGAALALFVLAYLALTHMGPPAWRAAWPRELGVAMLFAAGASLPAWAVGIPVIPPATVLGLLCWINMSLIEYREWLRPDRFYAHRPSASAIWLARNMRIVSIAFVCLVAALVLLSLVPPAFSIAAVVSCISLFALDRQSLYLSADAIRVGADLALCTPVLLIILNAIG